jgi:NADH dehydrogenase
MLKVRVRGIFAWVVRRTYYLLQMPGWSRRLRMMIDWTFALLFRPDIVKVSLDSEVAELLREAGAGRFAGPSAEQHPEEWASDNGTGTGRDRHARGVGV